jgi:hypothetical protein
MAQKTLKQIVSEKPFPDYATWWPMGREFSNFMSQAIVSQWAALPHNTGELSQVRAYLAEYLATTSGRAETPRLRVETSSGDSARAYPTVGTQARQAEARASLVEDFVRGQFSQPLQSGEFDALSYAFFRSAFELIDQRLSAYSHPLERERRLFTRRVGRVFFEQLHQHLQLALPLNLKGEAEFDQLNTAIAAVGHFLQQQGYLRDHFAFYFTETPSARTQAEVTTEYAGRQIHQTRADFLAALQRDGLAYALYEMGYPAILPSAVYLFHTIGEAQHHSSRIIEELFARVGYEARETDDFDPTGYPSDRVVELWEIRPMANTP